MGLKPLTLQMIPSCFHMTDASATDLDASCSASGPHQKKADVRLVVPDGSIRFLNCLVVPLHLLCRSDALVIGLPVPALAPADRLLPSRTYFLLPAHLFRSALSFASLAACLGGLKRPTGGGPAPQIPRPIEIQRTLAGRLQVRLCEEYLERLGRAEEEAAAEKREWRVCITEELAKDYKQLVRCRSWKPKLELIKESERRRRSPRAEEKRMKSGGEGRLRPSSPTLERRSGELRRGGCGGRARGGCVGRKDAMRSGDRAWFWSETREQN